MELDEDGKPVEKPRAEEFAGDDGVLVVPENEAAQLPDEELFEGSQNGRKKARRANGRGRRKR